jgi:hypothetical protein
MNTNDTTTTPALGDWLDDADRFSGNGAHVTITATDGEYTDFNLSADELQTMFRALAGKPTATPDILPGEDAGTDEPTFTVEMWTTDPYDGSISEIHARSYPTSTRKHDAIRNLATYALATPEAGPYHVRVPRKYIRVNSAQGVAWDTRNVASAAYFRIVGA